MTFMAFPTRAEAERYALYNGVQRRIPSPSGTITVDNIQPVGTSWIIADPTAGYSTFVDIVKDCGASLNGVSDDAVAVTKANAILLAAGGGCLYIPPGTLYTSVSIVLPDHSMLYGVKGASKIKVAEGTGVDAVTNADTTNGNTDVTVIGISIDGNRANISPQTEGHHGIYLIRCEDVIVENIYVTGTDGTGVLLTGAASIHGPYFVNNVFGYRCQKETLKITAGARMSQITNVTGHNSLNGNGITFDASQVSAANIAGRYNAGYGAWIRNVQGGSYVGIIAELNNLHGILAGGLLNVIASGWRGTSNGQGTADTYDDIHFSINDDVAGYGETDNFVLAGAVTGPSSILATSAGYSGTNKTRYGLYFEDASIDTVVGARIEGWTTRPGVTGDVRRFVNTKLYVNGSNT